MYLWGWSWWASEEGYYPLWETELHQPMRAPSWRRICVICREFAWANTDSPAGSSTGHMETSCSKGTWELANTSHQLLPLRLSWPEENLWQFNLSKLLHCKYKTLRKWRQPVKEEVVVLPLLPFATYWPQHFYSPVKLQESHSHLLAFLKRKKMKVLLIKKRGHICECAVYPPPGSCRHKDLPPLPFEDSWLGYCSDKHTSALLRCCNKRKYRLRCLCNKIWN